MGGPDNAASELRNDPIADDAKDNDDEGRVRGR